MLYGLANKGYASKKDRGNCDCLMIDKRVPIRSSEWSGTGTVIVVPSIFLCITM